MPRLFGFEDQAFRRLHQEEAAALRQVASRFLADQSFPEITAWTIEEGHRTTLGNDFRPGSLAAVLDHPAIAGLAEDEDGNLVETGGPQIITPEEFKAIRRKRAKKAPEGGRSPQREYLLSGSGLVCGLCGFSLGASPSNAGSRGHRCMPSTKQHPGGCGKVRIKADPLETYVAEHVLAEASKPEVRVEMERVRARVLAEVDDLRKQIEADRVRQRELGAEHGRGELSMAAFKEADKELKATIKKGTARVRFLEQVAQAPAGDVPDLVRWWKHAPQDAQRGLVWLMLEQIAVYPAASRGSRTVDGDRVALSWRNWDTPDSGLSGKES
ncbi:recombinase family protein [Streptomyces ipomoeae]|uniref:recombinase family protein n=1 Tax=Streptomyces ipomoeae TaxID=103232 RepID=UPI0015F02E8F|nr:recombinase family protein [Streptomyces ipomoeae]